jgi:hypothetical protein
LEALRGVREVSRLERGRQNETQKSKRMLERASLQE